MVSHVPALQFVILITFLMYIIAEMCVRFDQIFVSVNRFRIIKFLILVKSRVKEIDLHY